MNESPWENLINHFVSWTSFKFLLKGSRESILTDLKLPICLLFCLFVFFIGSASVDAVRKLMSHIDRINYGMGSTDSSLKH